MGKSNPSPLRYPGGKTSLLPLLTGVTYLNQIRHYNYAEPYAGGCGLALSLLFDNQVRSIHLNDIDPGIWSFWYSVLNHTDDFIEMIKTFPINLETWDAQKKIYNTSNSQDPLLLGFATFYLNRTNRSGIIKGAGVIGGREQNGIYKMDCRFNREDLIDKIKRIKKYRDRIVLTNFDAIEFMSQNHLPKDTLFFIDPPYFNKGATLYTSFYKPEDHKAVADTVKKLQFPWMITYDDTPEVRSLYADFRQYSFNINYSLQCKRKGNELLIISDDIHLGKYLHNYQNVA